MPWLINAAQLDKFRKSQKSLIILDASWHMPSAGRDAKAEFQANHIIDAQFFDVRAFNDKSPDAIHGNMLSLDEKAMGDLLGSMGIRNDYKIIFYDNSDLHTSCRAVWMLKVFGHNPQSLYVLDGGLAAWNAYGGKVEAGEPASSAKNYTVNLQKQYLRTLPEMKQNLLHHTAQVIDVRHAVRYAGGPEQKANLRQGHMPGSFSFPYTTLFDKSQQWRPLDKIRQQLTGIGADLNAPTVSTCGSGMSAPILNFALDLLGNVNNAVYNGSWSEWGEKTLFAGETSLDERPVITSIDS